MTLRKTLTISFSAYGNWVIRGTKRMKSERENWRRKFYRAERNDRPGELVSYCPTALAPSSQLLSLITAIGFLFPTYPLLIY
jgi:hypothetical protein